MKRAGILGAAALVLAADGFVLVKAAYNRAGPPTAQIELTERELRLSRPQRESTALLLGLSLKRNAFRFEDGPGWFDKAKLEELGYDCRLPLADQSARAHYRGMPARKAFAVLEYNQATPAGAGGDTLTWSRLQPVDAGRDIATLRKKYSGTARHVIVPALVRLFYAETWDANTRRFAPGAYLRGDVVQIMVSEISVQPSARPVLESLRLPTNDYFLTPEGLARGPRYSVVLHYGRNNEPWIDNVRPIAAPKQ